MTFHTAFNCGAMLQAIATQLALNKIGFDCTIIDYYPNSVEEENRQYSFNVCNFRFFIKGLLMPFSRIQKEGLLVLRNFVIK